MAGESASGSRRLASLYPVGTRVEVRLADDRWHPGRVTRHDHPGIWVVVEEGGLWFVTNGRHVRPSAGE